ncbi:MAG: redoxin domain-containing protein [Pedobacter sp.]
MAGYKDLPILPGKEGGNRKGPNFAALLFRIAARVLTCLDGFNPNQPTVIIYFNPECDHCQYEATEIGRQPERFAKANMILITPYDSTKRIEAFADKYKLWQVDNLVVLLDRNFQFKKYFGTSVFPSVFIYGANKRLLKQFIGEVKMEAVLKIIDGNEKL